MNALHMLEEHAIKPSTGTTEVGPIVTAALTGGRRRLRRRRAVYAAPAIAATGIAGIAGIAVSSSSADRAVHQPAVLATAPTATAPTGPELPEGDAAVEGGAAVEGVRVTHIPAGYHLASTYGPVSDDPGDPCFTDAGLHFLLDGETQGTGPGSWTDDIEVSVNRGPYREGTLPVLTDPVGRIVESTYSGPGNRQGILRDLRIQLAPELWATVRVTDLPVTTLRSIVDGLTLTAEVPSLPGC